MGLGIITCKFFDNAAFSTWAPAIFSDMPSTSTEFRTRMIYQKGMHSLPVTMPPNPPRQTHEPAWEIPTVNGTNDTIRFFRPRAFRASRSILCRSSSSVGAGLGSRCPTTPTSLRNKTPRINAKQSQDLKK